MKDIEVELKDLLVSELTRKNKFGDVDIDNFNSLLIHAFHQKTVRNLFYIEKSPGIWSDKQSAAKRLFDTLSSEEIETINENRFENIFHPALLEAMEIIQDKAREEAIVALSRHAAMKIIQDEAREEEKYSRFLELYGNAAAAEKKGNSRISVMYFMVFVVLVMVLAPLVWLGYADKPTINVEFNIGEIIGGLLIGVSAVTASVTYTMKYIAKNKQKEQTTIMS